jgi:serine/threonine protein kinase
LGHDKLLSQQVAIKLLNFGTSVKNSNMITKEIDALGQLRHKNIVKLLDYFPLPKKQQLIVVMEYLKGGELDDLWKGHLLFAGTESARIAGGYLEGALEAAELATKKLTSSYS